MVRTKDKDARQASLLQEAAGTSMNQTEDQDAYQAMAPKRKAPDAADAPPAKRAAGGGGPTLYLVDPVSAADLAKEVEWESGEGEFPIREGVEHKALKDAPAAARKVAQQLQRAL